jgi:hypothetical protein
MLPEIVAALTYLGTAPAATAISYSDRRLYLLNK